MRLVRIALLLLALLVALAPLPAPAVERVYSRGLYPSIQAIVTPLSNAVPIALLDVLIGLALVVVVIAFVRRAIARGLLSAVVRTILLLLTIAACAYLAFVALWGLNYRREPLETKIAFDRARVTSEGVRALGEHAVRLVNENHALAQSAPAETSLESALHAAQRILGDPRPAVPGVPKRSLLELYFRHAAIDGMTDPFFLEIILNPDALPFERPFVTLHEWAHLAGYTNEAEANFVAWLACSQGDARQRYSGWLSIYEHVLVLLPRADRAALAAKLDPGPRADLVAAAARYERSTPVVRDAARDVYDSYLRANRVREGIASYTGVVRLIVGTGVTDGQPVRLRVER